MIVTISQIIQKILNFDMYCVYSLPITYLSSYVNVVRVADLSFEQNFLVQKN